jgi:hypothetical protein
MGGHGNSARPAAFLVDASGTVRWRKVADAMIRDDPHALFDRMVRGNRNDVACHDFPDVCLFRGSSLQNDFTSVVAFGNNPREFALGDH